MPQMNQKPCLAYIKQKVNFPEHADTNTIYFIEDSQEIFIGETLIANYSTGGGGGSDVNVIISGTGDFIADASWNALTKTLTLTKSTLPTLSKGVDTETRPVGLQPGDTFTAMTDTDVSGHTVSDVNTEFTIPHQISDVILSAGDNPGYAKLTIVSTDPNKGDVTTSAQIIDVADFMASNNGVATNATVSLKHGPVADMDAATKKYVDDAIAGISGGMEFLGVSTTPITDGGSENPTINGQVVTDMKNGDIVIYDGNQFIWSGATGTWVKSSDTSAFVQKTTQVVAGNGLAGGGDLSSDVTLTHGATGTGEAGSVVADVANNEVIASVSYDEFGHVTEVTKGTVPGGGSGPTWNVVGQ